MSFLNRLLGSVRKRALDRDIEDEQRHHLELAAQELEGEGIGEQEARRRAAVRFGSRSGAQEETRDQDLLPWLDALTRDLRTAWRGLRHSPSYSLVVLLALCLGIGANTAAYSIVHAVLFRDLPYPEAERLTFIFTKIANGQRTWANYDDLKDWAADSKAFSSIAAWAPQTVNLTGSGEPTRLRGGFVSAGFFSTLGVLPTIGRSFGTDEVAPQGRRVAIASWGMWQEKFGGAANFLNSKILLNGEPYTIIGVLPASFDFPLDRIDVWMPYSSFPPYRPDRMGVNAAAIGRLRPEADMASGEQELNVKIRALAQQFPESNGQRIGAQVIPFHELMAEDLRPRVLLLGGAVLLVLLVACANIATLTVSRVLSRSRELGIRAALGASRSRLIAHLFSEQLLLSLAGAMLALLLAFGFTRIALVSDLLPRTMAPRMEWPVAFAALGLAILTAMVTGPLPAISLLRGRTLDVSTGGRSSSEGRSVSRIRTLLLTGSIAVSVMLLSGAGLLVRSFNAVTGIDLGFNPQNLLTLEYRMPATKYAKPEQQAEFHRRVAQEVASLPGVRSASVIMALPFSGNGDFGAYEVVGRGSAPRGSEPRAQINRVDPSYFQTIAIPLLRGRAFGAADGLGSRRVAVVSKSMADHSWPGKDPLNQSLVLLNREAGTQPWTVVGVVGDSKHNNLEESSQDKVYVPFAQYPHIFGTLAVRTPGNPMEYAGAVRQAIWKVDKDQPVWKVRTMESLVDLSVANRGVLAKLMSGFSGFALVLAMIGLYGVISYAVGRRAKEFGIRAAMGATRSLLIFTVLREGLRNIGIGLALGLACAIPAATVLRTQLFQTEVGQPEPYVVAVLALLITASFATVIPAIRAGMVNVADILRQD